MSDREPIRTTGGGRGAGDADVNRRRARSGNVEGARGRARGRSRGSPRGASRARAACRRRTRIPNRVPRVNPLDHLLGVVPFPGGLRFTCAEGTKASGDRDQRRGGARGEARGADRMRASGARAVASRSHAPAPEASFFPSADALPPSEVVAVAPAGAQNRRSDPAAPAPDRARSPRNISAAANIVACAARGPLRAIRPARGSTRRRNPETVGGDGSMRAMFQTHTSRRMRQPSGT